MLEMSVTWLCDSGMLACLDFEGGCDDDEGRIGGSSVDKHNRIAYNAIDNTKRSAEPHIDKRVVQPDGSVMELVVWKLPSPTQERPHGYKFRLNYSLVDGRTLVRYDNKIGKGDHKHIAGKEYPYQFTTPEQAVIDFLEDVTNSGGLI